MLNWRSECMYSDKLTIKYDVIYSFSTSSLLQCCILQCTSACKPGSLLFHYVTTIKQQGFGLVSPDSFLCGLGLGTSTNPTVCNCMLWSLAESQLDVFMYRPHSLVLRPPLFFVLRFAFSVIHGSGRAQKTGKAWSHPSRV